MPHTLLTCGKPTGTCVSPQLHPYTLPTWPTNGCTEQQRRSEQLLYQLFPNFIADQLRKGERATAETYPEVRAVLIGNLVLLLCGLTGWCVT